MRQEIQSSGRQTQPGAAVDVGKLPASEGISPAVPADTDSAPPPGKIQAPGGDAGTGGTAGRSGVACTGNGGLAAGVLIGIIKIYQWTISPWLPNCCRFEPTCSHYAVEALRLHGFWKGSLLMLWRLARCQPFCKGGLDPVPPPRKGKRPADAPESASDVRRQ